MSLDTAIRNVGEYYAAHYLADKNGFTKDIATHKKRWKEEGSQSVVRKLQSLSEGYFKAKTAALDYPDQSLRSKASVTEIEAWHPQVLHALGYQPDPTVIELTSEQKQLPVLLNLNRHNQPWLVVCEAGFCLSDGENDEEPLETEVAQHKQSTTNNETLPTLNTSWEKAVALLLKQEDRPRWVMMLSGSRIYLFDAHTYVQGRYLYIDLDEAYGRKQASTFEAICALVSCECLAPDAETDEVLHERLREGSLKSTHGVSEKLQVAVREAIQVIANGWSDARRAGNQGYKQLNEREKALPDGSRRITAEALRHDALVYVYRLLFCFYAEARGGELGILPINDDIYRLGYSLESLRDLIEQVEPETNTENGSYLSEHLSRLFSLIHQGFHPEASNQESNTEKYQWQNSIQLSEQADLFGGGSTQQQLTLNKSKETVSDKENISSAFESNKAFTIFPLTATLFSPEAMPILSRIKLPNSVLHRVLRCLSLGTGDRGKQIGRINYAELGIVQLGSVYEGLLSYKGFFAEEDLIQVIQKPKGNKTVLDNAIDPKIPTWFVPKTRQHEFKPGEIILEHRTKKARIYVMGEFILHLNGVDRVNSASYYTPEVLTRCVVSEALKERLKDFTPKQADDILKLKICEPAMGSAAFMVEAIDQLGREYLRLKQLETGRTIDPSDFEEELRRVRHYIAVHNVYGVDLNPTAVELGALSLWLASIHRLKIKSAGRDGSQEQYHPGATPWFGLRLRAGNSLIGARRAVWTKNQLLNGQYYGKKAQAPRQLKPGEERGEDEIYHFLVWDEDMVPAANNKLMKEHWPDECTDLREWRNKQVKADWSLEELAQARRVCKQIDTLWEDYAEHRVVGLVKTECTATVWPIGSASKVAREKSPSLGYQEDVKEKLEAQSGAFQRLKLLMDSWCSFYFWPLEDNKLLPSRQAWLSAAEVLVGGDQINDKSTKAMLDMQLSPYMNLQGLMDTSEEELPDTEELAAYVPWYSVARQVDQAQHFHHWELIFTEILGPKVSGAEPRGFDLMFGNPPWMGADWKDGVILSEFEPILGVRDAKSATLNSRRPKFLLNQSLRDNYRNQFILKEGLASFLRDKTLYPALSGMRVNLYKSFIERSWGLLFGIGVAGLLHPESVFDDPKGGIFRSEYYKRLKGHYQLKNELILFTDVHHVMTFSVNIYEGEGDKINFNAIYNLFSPQAISQSLRRGGEIINAAPGIKDRNGNWEVNGHPKRVINITGKELKLFSDLFEDSDTSYDFARLPQVHSIDFMKVLTKYSNVPQKLVDLKGSYLASDIFNETNAQKDGLISRMEAPSFQPGSAESWIISGPHFFVGNSFNKSPRSNCTANGHYDVVDLESISDDYLPRAVYRPGDSSGNCEKFYESIPEWPKPSKPQLDDNDKWVCGFWPIDVDDLDGWTALLGEKPKLYGIDTSLIGAKTGRSFGYFSTWKGDILEALVWLKNHNHHRNSEEFNSRFPSIKLTQTIPNAEELLRLPTPVTSRTRLIVRDMCHPANERTLIGALIPPGATAINTGRVLTMLDLGDLISFTGHVISIVGDFYIKLKGRSHVHNTDLESLVMPSSKSIKAALVPRVLGLQAITNSFSDLKSIQYQKILNPLERRLALLEIDVLCALDLGLSIEELIQIYRVQFFVMKSYEETDQYDQKGRRLPNTTRKDAGAKELREALKNHDGESPVEVSWPIDNGKQTVTKTFYPPFNHVDRIEDYRTAYRVFSERLGLNTASTDGA